MDGSTTPACPEGNTAGDEDIRNEALPPSESSSTGNPVRHATESNSGRPPGTSPTPVTPEERIREHAEQALRGPDALIAAISSAGDDLLLVQRAIINVITEMIRSDADPLGAIGDAAPHLNLALKAGSQSLQFHGFAERLHRQKGVPSPSE